MSTLTEVNDQPGTLTPPSARKQDEDAWQAWLAKGRARDQRGSARRIQALKLALTAILLAMAGFWAQSVHYDFAARLVVAAGALILMTQAFRARSYAFAAGFGLMIWLYNPIAPVFSFAGDWQRALVLASTIPLILSFGWDKPKQATQ